MDIINIIGEKTGKKQNACLKTSWRILAKLCFQTGILCMKSVCLLAAKPSP